MPLNLDIETSATAELEDVFAHFSSIDISDREAFVEGAPVLRALANNRSFLTSRICDELKNVYSLQAENQYSAQVFFLGKGRNFFLRANFWPAEDDQIIEASGKRSFFYGVPHDHNFDFLTVGYHGPGYISEFYEYDYDKVVGYIGEPLDLRFVSREALATGRMMLYRASLDIHDQIPPESFSISLNVVSDIGSKISTINQYMVDLPTRTIESLGNRSSLPLLCQVAAHIGDDECRIVISDLCSQHPNPRGRYEAYEALAALCPADQERIWTRGAADPASHVSVQARARLAAISDLGMRGAALLHSQHA